MFTRLNKPKHFQLRQQSTTINILCKGGRSCPSAPGSGRGRRGAQPQPRCLWTRCRSTFRAGTPRHENVKNWRLLAAKSTQNLCTPRTPELPSEAPREAHLRELRPLRPVHELLPRRSRDCSAVAHVEVLAARPGIGLVLPPHCFGYRVTPVLLQTQRARVLQLRAAGQGRKKPRCAVGSLRPFVEAPGPGLTKKAAPKNLELLLLVSNTTSQTTGFL